MISLQIFLLGLLIVSTLTGLVTEAVKKILTEYGKNYYANTLSGFIAFLLSTAVGVFYALMMNIEFTTQTVISIIALIFMSWLCAMVGYDKVIQAINQFKTYKKDSNE